MSSFAIGWAQIGRWPIAGANSRVPPSATVLSPGLTVTGSPLLVSWSYTSVSALPQQQYRVTLTRGDQSIADTGVVSSNATSVVLDVALENLSSYTVSVAVSDGTDWSTASTVTFLFDAGAVSATELVPSVGTFYEVGIAGVGFMLADDPSGDMRYQRRSGTLDVERLATTETPFSQAVDRYTFLSFAGFRAGSGQALLSREDSSSEAYWSSDGINPFDGTLKLLKRTERILTTGHTNPRMVVTGDDLYVLTGPNQITRLRGDGGSTVSFSVAAATTIETVASEGGAWYAAAGSAGVFRGTGASDPGAAWSSVQASVIAWAGQRVCVAYPSSSSTPNRFSTIGPAGTEEVAGGRLTLPAGWTIPSIVGGGGDVWFVAWAGQQGVLYRWQVGSTDPPAVAYEFPTGQRPVVVGFYQGNVLVKCVQGLESVVYRIATQGSTLVPTVVTRIADTGSSGFAGTDRFALFGWTSMASQSGVGCIDLSTGGWARWIKGITSSAVVDVAVWQGRPVFSCQSDGLYHEHPTDVVTSGTWVSSRADLATVVRKQIDELSVLMSPLPTGTTATVELSYDGGQTFRPVPGAEATQAGTTVTTAPVGIEASSIACRVVLTGSSTFSPSVDAVTVRLHPFGMADQLMVMPVNCSDETTALNGATIAGRGAGAGALRARFLEGLVGRQVLVQDVDWHITGQALVWEVVSVDVRAVGARQARTGRAQHTMVAVVTLRRPAT